MSLATAYSDPTLNSCAADLEVLDRRLASSSPPPTHEYRTLSLHYEFHELEFPHTEHYALKRLEEIHNHPHPERKNQELETFLRDLCRARERDRQRALILEMVGGHAPLTRILAAIAMLARNCNNTTGAAIWVANDNTFSLQASAGLPDGLDAIASDLILDIDDEISAQRCNAFEDRIRLGAAQYGNLAEFVPLLDGKGRIGGLLAVFGPDDNSGGTPAGILMQLAHLASLAIESDKLHEQLAFHAQHDSLTGLPNRLLFHDRLKHSVTEAEHNHEKVAVLGVDLDHYKQINDTLGHTAGDELLCEVGRRLRASVHHADTVARFGGDEFTMVISNVGSESVVQAIAARILKAICRPVNLNGHEVRISASIGMSIYPDHGLDADLLVRNADLGMYHAKRRGRNQCQIFLPQFGNSLERRIEIEEQMRKAIELNEFHLEYQPLIGLHGDIAGIEALLRWNSPKLGPVSPAEFIPLAEESGLIGAIGEWVARAACRDGAHWIRSGVDVARIAINVSALQLVDRDFTATIARALRDFGFPATKLEVEVTETVLIGNLERAVDQIAQLRTMGVHFSIDDFGTGYSSLNQLRTLPVDHLKIDRSFIQDIDQLEGNSLVRGIIALAHSLQLTVVAEGVETEAQLAALHSMGCDRNQGFHLHRPMAADAMMRLLSCR
jgi:diguanylate cyclase (GGDEF)-like protein